VIGGAANHLADGCRLIQSGACVLAADPGISATTSTWSDSSINVNQGLAATLDDRPLRFLIDLDIAERLKRDRFAARAEFYPSTALSLLSPNSPVRAGCGKRPSASCFPSL